MVSIHAVLDIEPEIRFHLTAAGQRNEQAVGDVSLAQANLVRECSIDHNIDLRITVSLLDAQVGDPGHFADSLEEISRIRVIGFLLRSDHLQINRRR
jgi:hypothetical protein